MDEANRASPGPVPPEAQPAPLEAQAAPAAAQPDPNAAQPVPDAAAQPVPDAAASPAHALAAQQAPAVAARADSVHTLRAFLRSRISGAAATVLPNQDPLPPPFDVAEKLPVFTSCGANMSCSHELSGRDREILDRGPAAAVDVYRAPHWPCRDCRAPLPQGGVHVLPCGHVLCRACLVAAARAVSTTVRACKQEIGRWIRLREAAGLAKPDSVPALDAAAAVAGGPMMPQPQQVADGRALDRVFDEANDVAFRVAGSTCCGRRFDLRDHLECLEERAARALWRDMEYLRSNSLDWVGGFCGWVDCGSFVPVKFHYEHPWEGVHVMHCLVCKGNSVRRYEEGKWSRPCR
ncbi:uncharacterized protein E0L32_000474 [Thyridium curvatum]|uniref:RING-type domain-containing protein n=1 Tax=Thyridium curvatum TaxID=1093900 RepID=A0A507BBT8_9PEZI|nr:uncharacterized protein E0L32_000474 [Thyridium curvatum]TPX14080.1 hypothetical protein E0L32_000474 [Thyridium curvatum]